MPGIYVQVEGVEALKKKLAHLGKRAQAAFEDALILEAGAVMNEGQRRVPVVTGRLRSSAFVRPVQRNQYRSDLRFGYAAPYAIYVHEIPGGRGYKWLANAVNATMRGRHGRMLAVIQRVLR